MTRKSHHPLYPCWRGILSRCNNPKSTAYRHYGGRGIRVCDRWLDFNNFVTDMGPRPFIDATIDRRNTNGNYCPSNCRWLHGKKQARNTRSNRLITFDGKTQCLAAWAEELGIPQSRISYRKRVGWSDSDALLLPRDERKLMLEFDGQTKPMRTWANELGIGYRTIWFRLSKGWSIEKALTSHVMSAAESGKCVSAAFGERAGGHKLKTRQVLEIRARYAQGNTTYQKLATAYEVGLTTIFWIIKGKTWKHVKSESES